MKDAHNPTFDCSRCEGTASYHALAEQVWGGMPDARARQLTEDLARLSKKAEKVPINTKDLL